MTNLTPSAPRSGSGSGGSAPKGVTYLVIGVAMVVLFALGFGVSRLLSNRSSSSDNAGPEPTPCVTTTVVPGAGLPKPAKVTVNVYNSTDRAGLARRTATALAGRGFVIGKVANDPLGQPVAATAEVRHGPDGLAAAQLVAIYVPKSVLVDDGRKGAGVDLAIGEAYTGLASPAAVQKALTQPRPVVSPPGCGATTAASPAASPSA